MKTIITVNEELQDVKQQASMLDTLQAEVKLPRQQSEGSELAKKQIKELKQQMSLILESKALVEDERNVLLSKLENVSSWEEDRDRLKGKIAALELEQDNSSSILQDLIEANAKLEIDKDRKDIKIKELMEEIECARHPPVVLESPKGIMSSVGFVENSTKAIAIEREEVMAAQMRKLEREKENLELSLNCLREYYVGFQEQIAKDNNEMANQLQTVQKENIRIKRELAEVKKDYSELEKCLEEQEVTIGKLHEEIVAMKKLSEV